MKKNELLVILAAGIRRCRNRLGLTIEQLAEASGVDAGYLAHVEIGRKSPSLKTIWKLARGLDVSPEELFRGQGRKAVQRQDAVDRRFAAFLRSLKSGQKADLLAALSKLRGRDQIKGLKLLLGG